VAWSLRKYQEFVDRIEKFKKEEARAEGQEEEILSRLQKEFGCMDFQDLDELEARLKKELSDLEQSLSTEEFELRFGKLLEDEHGL
jgi:hypothetical protein